MTEIRTTTRPMRARPLVTALALIFAGGIASEGTAVMAAPFPTNAIGKDRYALRLQSRRLRASQPFVAHTQAPGARAPSGKTIPVTSCLDDADPGTLRNVLAGASEGDTVDLSKLTCSTITLTQGAIDTSALSEHQLYDVTLQGPGRDALTIEAAGQSQVLVVGGFSSDKGTFTASDLTIANGTYDGSLAACIEGFGGAVALNRVSVTNCHASGGYPVVFGGAVDVTTLLMTDSSITNSSSSGTGAANTAVGAGAYASDVAVLVNSVVSGNVLSAPMAATDGGYHTLGGGLYVRGDLTLTDSTISGNSIEATADGQNAPGGGVYVRGIATISGSTIDGNIADGDGGGLFKAIFSVYGEPGPPNPPTTLTITNSTISGNSAARGGGIATSRPLYLANSTVAFNTGVIGGGGVMFLLAGIEDSGGTLDTQSAIIAVNSVGDAPAFAADLGADAALSVTGADNLIIDADAAIALPTGTIAADPLLLPLADNGGPTRTHALVPASPAVDAGNNAAALEFDQRGAGFPRVSGARADIGAVELSDAIFADGFDTAGPASIEYAYDDGDGDTNQGPPSTFDPDMLWGNYYLAQPGGEFITRISTAFGPTFPSLANGPVTFWLLEDDDADSDPRNAHVIASAQATPDVFNDMFYSVDIPPTPVHGGFFVGASAKLLGGQDRPARVDTDASGHMSWFFYAPDIAATIDDLAAAPFGTRNDDTQYVPLPGAFMVRASGTGKLL
jgi:hypothetical protein